MGENDHKPETSHGVTTGQDEPRRRRKRPKRERLMSSTGITIFVMINGFIVVSKPLTFLFEMSNGIEFTSLKFQLFTLGILHYFCQRNWIEVIYSTMFVCLFVCLPNIIKSSQWISMTFLEKVQEKNWFNYQLDPGIFQFYQHCKIRQFFSFSDNIITIISPITGCGHWMRPSLSTCFGRYSWLYGVHI